ncbi:hypothetical protein FrEUN1fDRAFT_7632 [Parafrankia sp. EUN1f]|nr:hypothetical protein FrEUN1fDRAFT_7632 [Parafrankia sp. EUN1f]
MATGFIVTLALQFPEGQGGDDFGVKILEVPSVDVERIVLLKDPNHFEVLASIAFSAELIPRLDETRPLFRARETIKHLASVGTLPAATIVTDIISCDWRSSDLPYLSGDEAAELWPQGGKRPPVLWWDLCRYMTGKSADRVADPWRISDFYEIPKNRILWRRPTKLDSFRVEYSEAHIILRASNGDKLFSRSALPFGWFEELTSRGECLAVTSFDSYPSDPKSVWLRKSAQREQARGGKVLAIRRQAPPDADHIEGCTFIKPRTYDDSIRRQVYLDSNILIDLENWFYGARSSPKDKSRLKNILLALAGDDLIPGLAIEETSRTRLAEQQNLQRKTRSIHAVQTVMYWLPEQIEAEFDQAAPAVTRFPLRDHQISLSVDGSARDDGSIFPYFQAPTYAILLRLHQLLKPRFSGPHDRISRFRKLVGWIDHELFVGKPLALKVAINAFFGCEDGSDYVQRLLKPDSRDPVHAAWTAMWDLTFLQTLDYGNSFDPSAFNPCLVTRDQAIIPLHRSCAPAGSMRTEGKPSSAYMAKLDIGRRWKVYESEIVEILEGHENNQRNRIVERLAGGGDLEEKIGRTRLIALALEEEIERTRPSRA